MTFLVENVGRRIPLTGKVGASMSVLLDCSDHDELLRRDLRKWSLCSGRYAAMKRGRQSILLHRILLGAERGQYTDHVNGNGLDNRRRNIRICTQSQNLANRPGKQNPKSGYKGVYADRKKWIAQLTYHGQSIHIGSFEKPIDAAHAYDKAARKYFGEFARLNFEE